MTTPHRIVFAETGAEEQAFLAAHVPPNWSVQWLAQALTRADAVPDCEVLSVFVHSPVTRALLARLPSLKLVATRSTGVDHIDVAACRERGVAVCNVPDYGSRTVAEHAFALLLAVARRLTLAAARVRRGEFGSDGLRGMELAGKTFGVVGTGRIGAHAAAIARGFGMRVLATDPYPDAALARAGVEYVALSALLAQSDIVSLHCPATPQTRHLIDAAAFARMKPGVVLINTARGEVVDAAALADALDSGVVAGAGLDVLEQESCLHYPPCPTDSNVVRANGRLIGHDNVVVTPHIAFNTREAVERLRRTTLGNIERFLAGTPQNLVVPSAPP